MGLFSWTHFSSTLFLFDYLAYTEYILPESTRVLGGIGSRVKTPAGANKGSIPLHTGAITESLHFLLFSVCRSIICRDYFEEFHVHFISSFMLAVSSAYTKNLSYLYLSHPLKRGDEPFIMYCLLKGLLMQSTLNITI